MLQLPEFDLLLLLVHVTQFGLLLDRGIDMARAYRIDADVVLGEL